MNPNNPYAAPQTLEPRSNVVVVLPMAEEQPDPLGRMLFPEIGTATLARIEAASRAIRQMTILWTASLAGLLIGVVMTSLSLDAPLLWLAMTAGSLVIAFRIYAGVERSSSMRYFSLLIDSVPLIATIYFSLREVQDLVNQHFVRPEAVLFVILVAAVVCYLPGTSVVAHSRYFRLFGDERFLHDDLSRELTHRRKYRIL